MMIFKDDFLCRDDAPPARLAQAANGWRPAVGMDDIDYDDASIDHQFNDARL